MNAANYKQWLAGLVKDDAVLIISGKFKQPSTPATVTYRCSMFIYAGGMKFSNKTGFETHNRQFRGRLTKP